MARIGRLRSGKHRDAAVRDIPKGRREHSHQEPGRPGDIGVRTVAVVADRRRRGAGRHPDERVSASGGRSGLRGTRCDRSTHRAPDSSSKNLSLGTVFPPFDLDQPSPSPTNPNFPVTVEGRTAEWIVVKRQTEAHTTNLRPFCDYGAVMFYGCNAQVHTATGASEDRQLDLATTIRLADWNSRRPAGWTSPGYINQASSYRPRRSRVTTACS